MLFFSVVTETTSSNSFIWKRPLHKNFHSILEIPLEKIQQLMAVCVVASSFWLSRIKTWVFKEDFHTKALALLLLLTVWSQVWIFCISTQFSVKWRQWFQLFWIRPFSIRRIGGRTWSSYYSGWQALNTWGFVAFLLFCNLFLSKYLLSVCCVLEGLPWWLRW